MLPKINRLKNKKDFDRVFKRGKGFKGDFLFLKIIKNNLSVSRFGFVVGRNVAKKATARNIIKRKLRAVVETHLAEMEKGVDAVLVVTRGLGARNVSEVGVSADNLFKKAKLFND